MEDNINHYKRVYYSNKIRGSLIYIICFIISVLYFTQFKNATLEHIFAITSIMYSLLLIYVVVYNLKKQNIMLSIFFKKHVKYNGMYFFFRKGVGSYIWIEDLNGREYDINYQDDTIEMSQIYDKVIIPYLNNSEYIKGDIRWK